MFKIFFELGEMDNIEKNLLAEASNRLDVGEFQFLQLGYAEWFGSELDAKSMEAVFFAYLTQDTVPHWARHYARKVIALSDEGKLDHNDPRFHRYDASSMRSQAPQAGVLKVAAVVAVRRGAAGRIDVPAPRVRRRTVSLHVPALPLDSLALPGAALRPLGHGKESTP